ncbi:MAG: hypothetical protein LBN42_01860, partial [Oscillospiraceae bacterium]|nr:hypothetical protein [Oscillospiraceae bacterium]
MNDKLPVIGISESQAERRLKSGGSAEYLKVRTPYFSEIAPIIIYGAVFLLSTAVIIGSDGWLRTFGVAAAIISAAYTAFYITRADYIGKYKGRNVLIPIFDETDARTARLKNITVTVMRSGEQTKTDITKLVLGDVIMLETGDVVPADCEIVACNSLSTDEVILGGEAVREKKVKFAANAQRSDYTLYAGSIIVSGAATAEIIRVGKNTRYF